MATVFSTIRQKPEYPWQEVLTGAQIAGYATRWGFHKEEATKNDILITWNCYGVWANRAKEMNEIGGIHICMENGYLPKDSSGMSYHAFGTHGFCGWNGHVWPEPNKTRWDALGIQLKDWRIRKGSYILVCGQRGGGYSELAMTNDWPDKILEELRLHTDRPIIFRPHPGRPIKPRFNHKGVIVTSHEIPLEYDLQGAWAVVVYTSSCALRAVIQGVPAFYCGPYCSAGDMAHRGIQHIETPSYLPRSTRLYQLANAQRSIAEIKSGSVWKEKDLLHVAA